MADPHRLAERARTIAPFRVVEMMEAAWRLEANGRSVIRLVVGEPDFGTPASVVAAAAAGVADGRVGYTSSLGMPRLRQAIAAYYGERFGVEVAAERVVVTAGASAALLLALGAVLERDEHLLLTDPGYPCNRSFVRFLEGAARGVPVDDTTAYQLTAELVQASWTSSTRGVLLASPSNPTGTVVEPAEMATITDVVSELGGTCLVDEIYGELVYGRAPATVLAHTDDAFVVSSFSKTFAMTGWRLGWLVVPAWAVDAIERLAQNLYISPPTPSQWAGLAAFTPEVWAEVGERRAELERRRDVLVEGLRSIGFGVPVLPQGAFYVYADCSAFGPDSYAFAHSLLEETGVAVTPGNDFGTHRAERHVRFSYATSLDDIEEALARMAKHLT
jgi:aspartate/methionine/tyrosine aminotransferase